MRFICRLWRIGEGNRLLYADERVSILDKR